MPVPPSSASARSPRRRSPMTRRRSASCAIASGRPARRRSHRRRPTSPPRSRSSGCGRRSRSRAARAPDRAHRRRQAADVPREPVGRADHACGVTPAGIARALVGWDPVAVRRVASRVGSVDARDRLRRVTLAPFGSLFVRRRERARPPRDRVRAHPARRRVAVELPGARTAVTSSATRGGGRSSATPGAASRARASIATTSRSPSALAARRSCVRLEFASVCDIARVVVNGQDCGIAWTPPFRVDISSAAARRGQPPRGARRHAVAQSPHRRGGARRPGRSSRR